MMGIAVFRSGSSIFGISGIQLVFFGGRGDTLDEDLYVKEVGLMVVVVFWVCIGGCLIVMAGLIVVDVDVIVEAVMLVGVLLSVKL